MNDTIAKNLGLVPLSETVPEKIEFLPPTVTEEPQQVSTAVQQQVSSDFETARENLLNIIKNGGEAIDELLGLAQQSQDPKSFEALSSLMNTIVNANRQLLEFHKRIRDINKEDISPTKKPDNVTNNLFVGTTEQLLKIIKGEQT